VGGGARVIGREKRENSKTQPNKKCENNEEKESCTYTICAKTKNEKKERSGGGSRR
jgi:hypothetical protein